MSDNSWYEKGELPPVGYRVYLNCKSCVCEYVEKMHGKEAEILMHRISSTGNPVAVFCVIDDDGFNSYHALTKNDNFRPIKTKRELAIEDIKKIIVSHGLLGNDGTASGEIAGKLYDAGYRKNES